MGTSNVVSGSGWESLFAVVPVTIIGNKKVGTEGGAPETMIDGKVENALEASGGCSGQYIGGVNSGSGE